MPHDFCMFRFIITFASHFPMGKGVKTSVKGTVGFKSSVFFFSFFWKTKKSIISCRAGLKFLVYWFLERIFSFEWLWGPSIPSSSWGQFYDILLFERWGSQGRGSKWCQAVCDFCEEPIVPVLKKINLEQFQFWVRFFKRNKIPV